LHLCSHYGILRNSEQRGKQGLSLKINDQWSMINDQWSKWSIIANKDQSSMTSNTIHKLQYSAFTWSQNVIRRVRNYAYHNSPN
jgi:hypothetical protein